jgi:hypothetical protein
MTFLSAIVSILSFRIRSRAALELEVIALAPSTGRPEAATPMSREVSLRGPAALDLLCRIWPQAINVMGLITPTTVMRGHRRGFRLAWRWRSGALRPGRPKIASDTRDMIRQMSTANPLWGAPRIHGELLKLGIAQARNQGESSHCWALHAVAAQRALPDLAQLPAKSHDGHRRGGHVRGCDRDIWAPLCCDCP